MSLRIYDTNAKHLKQFQDSKAKGASSYALNEHSMPHNINRNYLVENVLGRNNMACAIRREREHHMRASMYACSWRGRAFAPDDNAIDTGFSAWIQCAIQSHIRCEKE